jgi:DNA repair protein RecO (recombination protein O)
LLLELIKTMPERDHSFHAEAVVLRHNDWGEADRILVLYTREMGKLRAVAKGVRKIRSRKAGHLEPFTRVRLYLARARDLPIITQAETVEAYQPIREDLLRTGYAIYLLELIDRFTYEEGSNRLLYSLLTDSLARLAGLEPPWLVARYYEMQLLDGVGYRPELFNCVNCRREIKAEDQFFSNLTGGVLCPECGVGQPGARGVSMQALKYLRHLQRSSYAEASRVSILPPVTLEMESLLYGYLTFLLERNLNTPTFLREVRESYGDHPA